MKNKLKGSLDVEYQPEIPSRAYLLKIEKKNFWDRIFNNDSTVDEFTLVRRLLRDINREFSSRNFPYALDIIERAVSENLISRTTGDVIPLYLRNF